MRITVEDDVRKVKIENLSRGNVFMLENELFMVVDSTSMDNIRVVHLNSGTLINMINADDFFIEGQQIFNDFEETEVYLMDCELIARKKQRI